eukprot:GFUD01105216.1.p1 GENE.GFUD01105216.1~~GFUD01105216.1.p1  ORF type:complete len:159 (-),score=27.97 GFUD01105216.1:58-501(-)
MRKWNASYSTLTLQKLIHIIIVLPIFQDGFQFFKMVSNFSRWFPIFQDTRRAGEINYSIHTVSNGPCGGEDFKKFSSIAQSVNKLLIRQNNESQIILEDTVAASDDQEEFDSAILKKIESGLSLVKTVSFLIGRKSINKVHIYTPIQ